MGTESEQWDERDLIRAAQRDDGAALAELVRRYEPTVQSIAGDYWGDRKDIVAGGHVGLIEAIRRFDLRRNTGLRAYAKEWIRRGMRESVRDWSRAGQAGETRADRFAFSNPNATAQEVADKVGCSLSDAEAAIDRQSITHERYYEGGEDGEQATRVAASHDMRREYDALSRYQLSPQLWLHEAASRHIDGLVASQHAHARRRLQEIGRRRFALELVERGNKRSLA